MSSDTKPSVVIVGGGFAGYYAARGLAGHADVTLIDSNGFQTFQPLLYQVATGLMSTDTVAYSLGQVEGIAAVRGSVAAVDLAQRQVTLTTSPTGAVPGTLPSPGQQAGASGTQASSPGASAASISEPHGHIGADFIVLCPGARVNFFGVDGAADHAFPLYTLADAIAIKKRLQQLVVANEPFEVVVVGAGATGVEVTGALLDSINDLLPRSFPEFSKDKVTVHVVDRAAEPLAAMSRESQARAAQVLEQSGVRMHLGRSAQSVAAATVTLDDGTLLPSSLTIWAGGLRPTLPDLTPAPPLGHGWRVVIDATLRIPGNERVFCLGDAAADARSPLPQLGAVAKQQGSHTARSIRRLARGKQPKPFEYRDLGTMAMIRHDSAVVEAGPHHDAIVGYPAYLMWLALHAYLLPGVGDKEAAVHAWVRQRVDGRTAFLMD